MTWFKVDDKFHSSEEVLSIPSERRAAAIGVWTLAGAWSADHLKDGHVPLYVLGLVGGSEDAASDLVLVKLWTKTRRGYQFRNWSKWQITRAQVEATRQAERDRKAAYRAGKQQPPGVGPEGVPLGHNRIPDTPSRPVPSRPSKDSSTKSPGAAKRGTRVPLDFIISDEMRVWARGEVPLVDVDKKLPEWLDYWSGVPGEKGVKLDWVGTWRNGMRKQQEFAIRDGLGVVAKPKKRFNDAD